MQRKHYRTQTGSLVEVAPVLWFLLLMLTFPLLNLATVGLRYTFLLGASRDAVQAASVAKTFLVDLDSSNPSAVDAAQAIATQECADFKGIHLTNVTTNLVITNLNTNAVTIQSTPLSGPADTANFFYQVQVITTAKVDPFLTYRGAIFGNIPALTGPATFSLASQQMCENPTNMNQ